MKTEVWAETSFSEFNLIVYSMSNDKVTEHIVNADTTIGRLANSGEADIKIESPIVSRKQGRFFYQDEYYFYEDMNSTNGTYINGRLLGREAEDKKTRCMLRIGDVLRVDHKDLLAPHKDAVIMVIAKVGDSKISGKSVQLENASSIIIGRNAGGVNFQNDQVSEKHAIFSVSEGEWFVEDCNSTNGVFINNLRVSGKEKLYPLDVVRIVDYVFVYTGTALFYYCEENKSKQLVINIQERAVKRLLKKQVLLQDISLSIEQGEMVMLLGGSGAGKTTFINAVMGYEKAEGQILHDDVDIYKQYGKVKGEIGFVPQQDLLRLEDTVYMTLKNAAAMKMDIKSPHAEREERIALVLNSLGLSREKDSLVKKLSGGQRKRLSIAVELISNPSLFFLDEPDSGLDGIMARSLMEQLRVIANEGKIVMVITHAPDRVRDLFDKVIILAKGEKDNIGHLAFYGNINEAFNFFETDSLEGVVKKINRVDEGGDGMSDYYISKFEKYSGRI